MENPFNLEGLSLDDESTPKEALDLTARTRSIVSESENDPSKLPEVLLELLTKITKPLFSSGHPQLTPAGRRPAYAAPPTLPHAVPITIHEEKAWKIPLTIPLLRLILKTYPSLHIPQRKLVFEAHFPLLIPPILNIIDDTSADSKADGYLLLNLLCDAIIAADSDILKRTSLTDVFMDAIKLNFMLLPTLTPEDEALMVLQQLYPASLALIKARFEVVTSSTSSKHTKATQGTAQNEDEKQQVYLKIIFRHGLLASLAHLGAGTSTSFIPLTTFLVSQLNPTVEAMGIAAVVHLQTVLPMLRALLMDPFCTAAPGLLLATLNTMSVVIKVCAPRIKDQWWPECLRGLVGCWCNILDDEEDAKKKVDLAGAKEKVIAVTGALSTVVDDDEWFDAKKKLCEEAQDLDPLFGGS